MALISDALRQAFMPKHEYESLREEDRAWVKLQRPLWIYTVGIICLVIFVSTIVSLKIVFPGDNGKRPFCNGNRLQPLPIKNGGDSDLFPGAFYLTDQETVDYYWMVVFVPSMIAFLASLAYLVAGMNVAYSAPARHGCLKVVENNYCASKRGGVRCLSILNGVFAIIFGLLALFLGSSLLTLGSSCSLPLFWCYEIATWGLVILYSGIAIFLRRKASLILDESDFGGRNLGLEMLEPNTMVVTPDVERHGNEGFRTWIGSSLLSSDEEDEPDNYSESPQITRTSSNRQSIILK
ncbi:eukaryotic translation initiation factor [Salix suchowensis]|nr:eukaryotic translation initiation factor [Salix suchowensis]